MKVWFPEFFLECHREDEHRIETAEEMRRQGINCVDTDDPHLEECDLIFCGTFPTYHVVRKLWPNFPHIPAVFYCWDLYPFQFAATTRDGRPTVQACWWLEYIELLRKAKLVLVPSKCTIDRVHEIVGKNTRCEVVPSAVYPWEGEAFDGGYVMGVMREYTSEPNIYLIRETCDKLGIPCADHKHKLSWEDYTRKVLGARVLISPYYEASTGGLSLLEGLWNGKHSLVARSPRNGVSDYMADYATYFTYNDRKEFEDKLLELYNNPITHDTIETRRWITERYSNQVFTKKLVDCLRSVV